MHTIAKRMFGENISHQRMLGGNISPYVCLLLRRMHGKYLGIAGNVCLQAT